jgi:aminoglycoside phosphotransferase (APT) family kinase protein
VADLDLSKVPEVHHDNVGRALADAFGSGAVTSVDVVRGGASGALTYRVESSAGPHLLRVETLRGPMRSPHQYACMQIAAEAGIAPPIRYVDPDAGLVVLPFVTERPLTDHPGGPPAVAAAVGDLLARLHGEPGFPALGDYMENLGRMIGFLERSGRVALGLLDRHREGFERIRAAYRWEPDSFVSAHNDPNQFNVLYDGDRLWLIDWETASRNDPLIDVATASSFAGTTTELAEVLLRAWLGREPDALLRARRSLMYWLTRLYGGCILLTIVMDPATPQHVDLTPMSIVEFGARIASGDLVAGTPAATLAYAKIALASFVDALSTPDVDEVLRVAAAG